MGRCGLTLLLWRDVEDSPFFFIFGDVRKPPVSRSRDHVEFFLIGFYGFNCPLIPRGRLPWLYETGYFLGAEIECEVNWRLVLGDGDSDLSR